MLDAAGQQECDRAAPHVSRLCRPRAAASACMAAQRPRRQLPAACRAALAAQPGCRLAPRVQTARAQAAPHTDTRPLPCPQRGPRGGHAVWRGAAGPGEWLPRPPARRRRRSPNRVQARAWTHVPSRHQPLPGQGPSLSQQVPETASQPAAAAIHPRSPACGCLTCSRGWGCNQMLAPGASSRAIT